MDKAVREAAGRVDLDPALAKSIRRTFRAKYNDMVAMANDLWPGSVGLPMEVYIGLSMLADGHNIESAIRGIELQISELDKSYERVIDMMRKELQTGPVPAPQIATAKKESAAHS